MTAPCSRPASVFEHVFVQKHNFFPCASNNLLFFTSPRGIVFASPTAVQRPTFCHTSRSKRLRRWCPPVFCSRFNENGDRMSDLNFLNCRRSPNALYSVVSGTTDLGAEIHHYRTAVVLTFLQNAIIFYTLTFDFSCKTAAVWQVLFSV